MYVEVRIFRAKLHPVCSIDSVDLYCVI